MNGPSSTPSRLMALDNTLFSALSAEVVASVQRMIKQRETTELDTGAASSQAGVQGGSPLTKELREIEQRLLQESTELSGQATDSASSHAEVWEGLSFPQRFLAVAKRTYRPRELSRSDLMRLVSGETNISEETQRLVEVLWVGDKPNATNPTLSEIISYVADRERRQLPLEFFASVCLSKDQGVRKGKLAWFLDRRRLPHASGACL
jgi:hypothetical protein